MMTGQVYRRPGVRHVWSPPEGEEINSMLVHSGRVWVATGEGIYTLRAPGIRALWARVKEWFKS